MLLVAGGCRGGGSSAVSDNPTTDAAIQYGLAPKPDPRVKLQPDVVLVGGGGQSVRSVTSDGLTWNIDPKASRASDLKVGKIMFITARGVGRVVDVRRDAGDLAVTIAPLMDITEVIKDGDFSVKNPIPLDNTIIYNVGEPFWAAADGETIDPNKPPIAAGLPGKFTAGFPAAPLGQPRFQSAAQGPNRPPQPPPKRGGQTTAKAGGFSLTPICCSGGAGASFAYDSNGIRLLGTFKLLMKSPKASFHLAISGGTVTQAEFQVQGAAGLRVEIEGATDTGHNINKVLAIPVDFSVPIGQVLGIPFAASVDQILNLQTAFSSKDGNIKAAGEWGFGGALGFGYAGGSFGVRNIPSKVTVKQSVINSLSGISVGVNGIILAYKATFRVGIGAFGFTAGLYFGLTGTVGLSIGSAAGAPIKLCRGAQLSIFASYGVGYTIPAPIADLVNLFLKTFNTKPIPNKGGIGKDDIVFNRAVIDPDEPICRA